MKTRSKRTKNNGCECDGTTRAIFFWVAVGLAIGGFAIVLEQFIVHGIWWSWDQVAHHETLAIIFFTASIVIFITVAIIKYKK